jgi:O-antigen/teichoic acid export membrane protein
MLKRFVKDSLVYGASGIVTRGISLVLVPFYTRVFTPGDYGVIDLLGVVSAIVSSVFPLEITQAIARFYPDCKNADDAKQYASTALYYTMMSFGVFLVLAEIFAPQLSTMLFAGAVAESTFRVAALAIVTTGLFYFVQNQLRWRLEPSKHAVCSMVFSALALGGTVIFVLIFHTGVVGVFWAQVIAGTVGSLLGWYFGRTSYIFSFSKEKFKEMLAFSLPIVPSSMGILALTYTDRISITSIMTLGDLGIFGIGYRVASVVGLLMVGFQGAISPLIYSKYREANTPAEIARVFRYFSFLALLVAASLSIFGREILIVLTTPGFYSAATVIPFLVAATFFSNMHVFAPGLGIQKRTKYIAVINLIGALLNVGLNLLLVPMLGILGAATSTMISATAVFVAFMYFSQRFYVVPHDFRRLLAATAAVCALAAVGFFVNIPDMAVSVLLKLATLAVIALVLFSFKLVSIEEFKHHFAKLKMRFG